MIYKKDANFPYPLLTNTTKSYENGQFILDVELQENIHHFRFGIQYEIESDFINLLIEKRESTAYFSDPVER